ncbi:MAG: type II toxin-antitoxin system Phd/YefM family antitoxin [Actinomycetota bacterium]|jgi:prevent-host-death family protein|nr:type II toxin-antitoxin system Phd/YefM family antitoxin [Actinomycetota bacterium]
MTEVGVHEAKTHLSRLLRQVEAGEEVTIVRDGSPVARLVAVRRSREAFLGMDRGKFTVPEDFNDPDPEFEKYFE